MKSAITTHVLDTSLGRPGAGMPVRLELQGSGETWTEMGHGVTDANGRLAALIALLKLDAVKRRVLIFVGTDAAGARFTVDTSRMVLSPMPGLLTEIAVTAGQEVKAGETLAKIEAMKMENVLKAERDCVVDKLMAKPGESLSVDQIIIAFK